MARKDGGDEGDPSGSSRGACRGANVGSGEAHGAESMGTAVVPKEEEEVGAALQGSPVPARGSMRRSVQRHSMT